MFPRVLTLLLLLAAALLPSGCASVEESSDDQMNTFHDTPESAGDDHGWGTSIQAGGKQ
jgi:uncharacterized protein YceK